MNKHLIFLGTDGLTSTSANHVANMAKEFISHLEETLDQVSFVNSKAALIGTENFHILSEGIKSDKLATLKAHLDSIAEAKSLIAWLREAIKAKDTLLKAIKNLDIDGYCALNNLDKPTSPKEKPSITEEEYIGNLSVKDRNTYYTLETICATYGKFIHPEGAYNEAKKTLTKRISSPRTLMGSGRDAILYVYEPSVTPKEVDETFFELQSYYRECQARLNGMKHQMSTAIVFDQQKNAAALEEAYNAYSRELKALENALTRYKIEETKRIQELKIVIPNDLLDIYHVVSQLGKKE